MKVCILIPTYHPYRWVAPFMLQALDEHWPDHPPAWFCGLTREEAGTLPVLPVADAGLPRDWFAFVRDAALELRAQGFDQCYLLLEEHLPLAKCHSRHLNETLPELLEELEAGYIGLMGWDNRRYSTRAPILGAAHFHLMHLTSREAPRFHLHPSLWSLEALLDCLEMALRDAVHTPWRFEKICEKAEAPLAEKWKRGCYQVCGEAMAAHPVGPIRGWGKRVERFLFHKLMAVYPSLPRAWGATFWQLARFDDFFFNGPYPMFFSGVMAKGKINPMCVRYLRRWPARRAWLEKLLAVERDRESASALKANPGAGTSS